MRLPWYLMAKGKGGGGYKTASGPIVSVSDAQAAPLRSLNVNIDPVQAGSGDPSPDNVRPISGWSAVNVWRTGINVWDEEWELGYYNADTGAKASASDRIRSKNMISVRPGTAYYFKSPNGLNVMMYGIDLTFLGRLDNSYISGRTVSVPTNCYYLAFNSVPAYGTTYNHDISINYPATDHDYHSYSGAVYPITFPAAAGTVYGGTLTVNGDGSGTLVVTHVKRSVTSFDGVFGAVTYGYCVYKVISGTTHTVPNGEIGKMVSNIFGYSPETRTIQPLFTYGGKSGADTTHTFILPSSITSLDEANAWLSSNPTECMFYLATPVTYTMTPEEVGTILLQVGRNNIWADTGDVDVEYRVAGGVDPDLMKLAVAFMGRKFGK